MNYGATPAEWQHFAGKLGLRQDLLPVVSNPEAVISSASRMKDKGKTPSLYNRDREVTGISKWTGYSADESDIRRWEREPDYGMCIQTRYVRAIDIDVAEIFKADAIEQAVRAAIPGVSWPVRMRDNSGKRLIPFIFDGELYKRSFPVGAERVELLAYGQQFIAVGTHPSGSPYRWRGGLPEGIPVLTAEEVERLWDTLEMLFSTGEGYRARVPREGAGGSSAGEGTEDQVLAYLAEQGLILDYGPGDQVYIDCPWASGHSSDNGITQTAYFPAGTGGYARGHFKCMHDSCSGHEDHEFIAALGLELEGASDDDFEDFTPHPSAAGALLDSVALSRVVRDRQLPAIPGLEDGDDIETAVPGSGSLLPKEEARLRGDWPVLKVKTTQGPGYGAVLVTQDNVSKAMASPSFIGRKLRWDTFRDAVVWAGWNEAEGMEAWRPWADVDYTRAARTLDQRNFLTTPGIEKIRAAVYDVAREQEYDSAVSWLQTLPTWDGTARVERFLVDYLGAEDKAYTLAVSRYMWTALVGRILRPGCQADMAPILVGPQGVGKSTAVRSIAPDPDWAGELDLKLDDAARGRLMKGKLIVELGELRGLRTADLDGIKTFIPRPYDEWTPKYQELAQKVMRRCIFFGTTNGDDFLGDDSGERRWLPVEVTRADIKRIVADRNQLWAEALSMWQMVGIDWAEAQALGAEEHEKFKSVDEWENVVEEYLANGVIGMTPNEIGYVTMTDIWEHALQNDNARLGRAEQFRLASIMRRLGWIRSIQRVNGKRNRVWVRKA